MHQVLNNFLSSTTIHGCSYVHSDHSILQRILWGMVIFVGFLSCGVLYSHEMHYWSQNPVITTLDSIAAPVSMLQFPTVTVCPGLYSGVDQWSYLEKVLNFLSFECSNQTYYEALYPLCENTEDLRADFLVQFQEIAEKLGQLVSYDNYSLDLFSAGLGDNSLLCSLIHRIAQHRSSWNCLGVGFNNLNGFTNLLLTKRLTFDEFKAMAYTNIGKASIGTIVLKLLDNVSVVCSTPACVGLRDSFVKRYVNLMEFMMPPNIPFGHLMSNFINLTSAKTFHNNAPIRDVDASSCGSLLGKQDLFFHTYLANLSKSLGIDVSLFEVPAILASLDEARFRSPYATDAFFFTQCSHNGSKMDTSYRFNKCQRVWKDRLQDKKIDFENGANESCSTAWSKNLTIEAALKIMRFATRRGQRDFDIGDFRTQHTNLEQHFKYPSNKIGIGYYASSKQYDMTTILPQCEYFDDAQNPRNLGCSLFGPVLTDFGVCHAFNAKPMDTLLRQSSFQEAFVKAYKTDLKPNKTLYSGAGSGENYELKFYLDKNSLWRPDVAMAPFSVGISGSQNFFNMRSSNKVVRTGYVTSMDIQPIEVVATDSLMGLDVSQRKCRFAHENDEQVTQLFSFYSQSACQFECTIKYAREVCQCTPWNMPFPTEPAGTEHVICDLYGNFCFSQLLSNTQKMDDCNCAPDCNYIRFQINEKESFIEPSDFCTKENNVGLRILNEKVKWGYNAMIRKYRKFYQMVARNETKSGKDFIYDLCRQMMQNDIAIVKVRFEAPHYIRTVMDKRVTFGDKLSSLGGALSLFTGMSIISLFEVIFWFITFVNNYILAKLTRNVSRCA